MKKILVICFCLLFVLSLLNGCGQKKEAEKDTPAGHPEEIMDSTRMDSAAADTLAMDTLAPEMEDVPAEE
ncbi:MAG: hypothetical protein JXA92_13760 [candidate division Zixibacteria bacterium]|nr:hypothetical protein [candidate division Zixibacteria bacterium]